MTDDSINYPFMIDVAMRGMVRDILKRVSVTGLPGEHYFYISYRVDFPGVKMSEQLRAKYPKEITIVLQHQFWDFKVEEPQFQVTLSFGGTPEKLVVPFAALTAFADPSIKFGLQFQPTPEEAANAPSLPQIEIDVADENGDAAEKIISLDAFRKK